MVAEFLTPRQHAILMGVVALYLETGEPVGSSSIARLASTGTPVSSATVRNEMTALTAADFLEQPHTSAGRVPTARAFRLYVDELSRGTRIAGSRLPAKSQQQIDLRLSGLGGTGALLEETSLVLAAVSRGVGLAIAGAADAEELEHVHFSRLATGRILAVVVTKAGTVRDRVLTLTRDFSVRELETASAFLNERFHGCNIEQVRAELVRLLEQERNEYQRLLQSVEQLWSRTLPAREPLTVYVGGVGNLMRAPSRDHDRERLQCAMTALETKQRVIELLTAYMDAGKQHVSVVFNMEEQAPEMAGLVLIAAPARLGNDRTGAVGVIGTTRMDYETTMNAVIYVAEIFGRIL